MNVKKRVKMSTENKKSPILDSPWQRCFWEICEKMRKEKADKVEFKDVDDFLLEKGKMAMPDFLRWLGGKNKATQKLLTFLNHPLRCNIPKEFEDRYNKLWKAAAEESGLHG